MKKLLALLLSLVLCFSFAACKGDEGEKGGPSSSDSAQTGVSGSDTSSAETKDVFADAYTYGTTPAAARTLNNTAYKLMNEKELNVVFFGGSITHGQGASNPNLEVGTSWAALTTQWLKAQYPAAKINAVNKSIGGTGSMLALMRYERDVKSQNPDLIFIDYAINDNYQGFSKDQSAYTMETLIKAISSDFPTADIVIVLTTDKSNIGKDYDQLLAHKAVAEYYGIPCINVGTALNTALGGKAWSDYVTDSVHPNDAGYKIYADAVTTELGKLLPSSPTAAKNQILPKTDYLSNVSDGMTVTYAADIKHDGNWKLAKTSNVNSILKSDTLVPTKSGAEIVIEFEGSAIGLAVESRSSCKGTVTIDGTETREIVHKKTGTDIERIVFDNLSEDKHTAVISYEYEGTARFGIGAIYIGH